MNQLYMHQSSNVTARNGLKGKCLWGTEITYRNEIFKKFIESTFVLKSLSFENDYGICHEMFDIVAEQSIIPHGQ